MKVGIGRQWRDQETLDYVAYDDLWSLMTTIKPTGSMPAGAGSLADPYRPLGIGDWYWLSTLKFANGPIFLRVGDRLIARWGKDAGGLKGYCSDVSDVEPGLLETDTKSAIGEVKKTAEAIDKKLGLDTRPTVYAKKAGRVQVAANLAAAKARELLWIAETTEADAELANSIAGLLICESHPDRSPTGHAAIFLTTMMLLDLIEKGISYGKGHTKTYTWASMLTHGTSTVPYKDAIEGRGVGGTGITQVAKHPMAGEGTVAMGKKLDQPGDNNIARNRIVSVASIWVANYLAELEGGEEIFKYFVLSKNDKDFKLPVQPKGQAKIPGSAKVKSHRPLKELCEVAIRTRGGCTACLLTGARHKQIGYLDDAGKVLATTV